jgi:type II secretory pathway pseudopilin PulG
MRRAFTLIETLVALVIVEFAMLAAAATTAVAARNFATAHRMTRAQALARNRLELLVAGACSTAGSGSSVIAGEYDERWVVEASASLRRISVTIQYNQSASRRSQVALTSAVWCGP